MCHFCLSEALMKYSEVKLSNKMFIWLEISLLFTAFSFWLLDVLGLDAIFFFFFSHMFTEYFCVVKSESNERKINFWRFPYFSNSLKLLHLIILKDY